MKIYHVASFAHQGRPIMQPNVLDKTVCQPMTELLAGLVADGWMLDRMTTVVVDDLMVHTFIMAKDVAEAGITTEARAE